MRMLGRASERGGASKWSGEELRRSAYVIENGKLSTLSEMRPPISGGPRDILCYREGRADA